jgi:hypothetical protein
VLPFDTPDHPLGDTNQISVLLADSINRLRRGQLDPRVANAMGYLARVLLKALESARIEDRLAHCRSFPQAMQDPSRSSIAIRLIASEMARAAYRPASRAMVQ